MLFRSFSHLLPSSWSPKCSSTTGRTAGLLQPAAEIVGGAGGGGGGPGVRPSPSEPGSFGSSGSPAVAVAVAGSGSGGSRPPAPAAAIPAAAGLWNGLAGWLAVGDSRSLSSPPSTYMVG